MATAEDTTDQREPERWTVRTGLRWEEGTDVEVVSAADYDRIVEELERAKEFSYRSHRDRAEAAEREVERLKVELADLTWYAAKEEKRLREALQEIAELQMNGMDAPLRRLARAALAEPEEGE